MQPEPSPSRVRRVVFEERDGCVAARFEDERAGTGLVVDFGALRRPGGDAALRSMPLVRACGRDLARAGARLVDATAGLCYDAYLLASAGFDVVAVERSAEVRRLAEDALRRTPCDRLRLLAGDARTLVDALRPEVVYLDPMYPPKKRASALPPKEMQIVRALVGDDLDSEALFRAACGVARRVVVKRPAHAPAFEDERAPLAATIEGKLARFDVHVRVG